jgi:hypothetical protein
MEILGKKVKFWKKNIHTKNAKKNTLNQCIKKKQICPKVAQKNA